MLSQGEQPCVSEAWGGGKCRRSPAPLPQAPVSHFSGCGDSGCVLLSFCTGTGHRVASTQAPQHFSLLFILIQLSFRVFAVFPATAHTWAVAQTGQRGHLRALPASDQEVEDAVLKRHWGR